MSHGRGEGSLCLVLHSHMPYVEGFGTWPFGEEWLFEAVATVYLPLLDVLDGAPVTVTVTPVLADQLEALGGDAGERFRSFLRDVRAPIHAEDAQGMDEHGEPGLAAELRRAAGDYELADRLFDGDPLARIAALRGVELWTSSATHAVLPLLATRAGVALQVEAGVACHQRRFPGWRGGFWLPECAYAPGLEDELAAADVRVFCVDQTDEWGLGAADHLTPVATPSGAVAVPIDWQTVRLIWDFEHGYPVDGRYRDYHGRTLHDLKPWNIAGEPYDHGEALALAEEHASHFVAQVRERVAGGGLVCCALDTELLGHWWYEGIHWLRCVLREAEAQGLELETVSGAVARREPVQRELGLSSWGTPKDLSTWDSPQVAELAFSARSAELAAVAAAPGLGEGPRLQRAARELLALQSSDWAFQVTRDQAADYPIQRARAHVSAFEDALLDSAAEPDPRLRNLQPELDLSPLLRP